MTKPKAQGRGLRLIAAFKLLKGLALLALGIGALKLLHKDVEAIIVHWINVFQVDPHSHYLQLLFEKLSILNDRRLKELSVGTFIYSAIFLTEGAGLAFRKSWAEYLTIITTASLLPLEIYELANGFLFCIPGPASGALAKPYGIVSVYPSRTKVAASWP